MGTMYTHRHFISLSPYANVEAFYRECYVIHDLLIATINQILTFKTR